MSNSDKLRSTFELAEANEEFVEQQEYTQAISTLADRMLEAKQNTAPDDPAKQEFINNHKTNINDDDLSMFPRPRSGCRHCSGDGSEGWDVNKEEIILCRCIRNRVMKIFEESKLLTYGELREIYNRPRRLRGIPEIGGDYGKNNDSE